MSYIAERRLEEKERRRAQILDAAEAVAAKAGWDAVTMDQVARKARLSRALLYVYFKDKTDLMFGIGERAIEALGERFADAVRGRELGRDQLQAMGRAYVSFAREMPVYFEIVARCELHSASQHELQGNEGACAQAGERLQQLMVETIQRGIADGSLRPDLGQPEVVAIALWAFMHGVVQLMTTKANFLALRGVTAEQLVDAAIEIATRGIGSSEPSGRRRA
ncbi:MAG: TetR/AcrR family transcriptional regulator [Pseudomonadota bacterium]|jgi:Transcriptional regulator